MKYFIIAGEASGDLHGSNLVKELMNYDKEAEIVCWGGDKMENAGSKLLKHYRELAIMGFFEVLKNIFLILGFLKECKKEIAQFNPDVVILIDYPGFNLRIAKFVKKIGIKTYYYISPKLWAWNQRRAKKVKRYIDKMFTIFPFETEFYKKFNYSVEFVGNPLLDEIQNYRNQNIHKTDHAAESTIAILPGSRKQEIRNSLPIMLNVIQEYEKFNFIIAGAPGIEKEFYQEFIEMKNVEIRFNNTYQILNIANAALVTSGTATLEAALFDVPQIVCYKTGRISYHIAKRLIKVGYISLVNLIMNKKVVTELIQFKFNKKDLKKELDLILYDSEYKDRIKKDYKILREKLGGVGASKRAAEKIVNYLKS